MKTELITILQRIIESNVEIEVQNNNLKLKLPHGFSDELLVNKIRNNKSDLITFFNKVKKQNIQKIKKAEKKEFYYTPSVIKSSWMLNQLNENPVPQNCILEYKNFKNFDVEIFKKSLLILLNRHEILKTIFPVIKDVICQYILNDGYLDKIIKIFCVQSDNNYDDVYKTIFENSHHYIFDFCNEPLFKIIIVQKASFNSDIIILQDHAITDTTSCSIIINELGYIYSKLVSGLEAELEPQQFQYKDYSEWYKSYCKGNELIMAKLFFYNQFKSNALLKNLKDIFSIQAIDIDNVVEENSHSKLISKYFSNQVIQQVHTEYYHMAKLSPYSQNTAYNCRFYIHGSLFENLVKFSSMVRCTLGSIALISLALVNCILTDEQEFIFAQPIDIRRMDDTVKLCGYFVNQILIKVNLELNMKLNDAINLFNNHILKSHNYRQFHLSEIVNELDLSPKVMTPFILNNQTFDVLHENKDFIDHHDKVNWSAWASIIVNIRTYTNSIVFDIVYDGRTFEKTFIERIFSLQHNVLSEFVNNQNRCFQDILDKSQ